MERSHLENILLHSFSNDVNARKQAEMALQQLHTIPNALVILLEVLQLRSHPKEIRQAAAIAMKNCLQKVWKSPTDNEYNLGNDNVVHDFDEGFMEMGRSSHDEQPLKSADSSTHAFSLDDESIKNPFRPLLLETLLVETDSSIRELLLESFNIVARCDFPGRWSVLVEALCAAIQSGDALRMLNALKALRKLVKIFEFKKGEQREPMNAIAKMTFPLLRSMLEHLQGNQSIESAQIMQITCKIYWSCIQYKVVPFAAALPELNAWMLLLSNMLRKKLPDACEGLEPLHQPTDDDEREQWPWWKVKKWCLQIFTRFYSRWGNPKNVDEEYQAMSVHFRSNLAPQLLEPVMEILALRKQGRFCSDRVLQLALVFMQNAIEPALTYRWIKNHLTFLLLDVIHPALCLTRKDLALWESDAHEFVRKNHDVFEDYLNPVLAAASLLSDLCRKRGKDCLNPMLTFYNHILMDYQQKQQQQQQRQLQQQQQQQERTTTSSTTMFLTLQDALAKEGALHGLCALDHTLTLHSQTKDLIEPILLHHVVPEFHNTQHAFLRLRACKMFSKTFMKSIRFQNESILVAVVQGVLKCMEDAELPVQIEAAKTLRVLVLYEHSTVILDIIRPLLPQILNQYFKLMDEIGNDEVVIALETIIDRFGDEIGPFAIQLIEKFVLCFQQFSEAGLEDDESSMIAMQCLDTITTILMSIHNRPDFFPILEPSLLPILTHVLSSEDGIEYMDSVLDILSSLTYYSPSISPQLWSLFPILMTSFDSWAYDYMNNFVPVIDNFIGRDIEGFLQGFIVSHASHQQQEHQQQHAHQQNHHQQQQLLSNRTKISFLEMVVTMASKVLDHPNCDDMEVNSACRLFYSLLHNCFGRIDDWLPTILKTILVRLNLVGLPSSLIDHSLDSSNMMPKSCLEGEKSSNNKELTNRNLAYLYGTLASAVFYNASLTLHVLMEWQATDNVFQHWMKQASEEANVLTSVLDKKLFVLGSMSLLRLPLNQLPMLLQNNLKPMLVQAGRVLKSMVELEKQIDRENNSEDEDEQDEDEQDHEQANKDADENGNEQAHAQLSSQKGGEGGGRSSSSGRSGRSKVSLEEGYQSNEDADDDDVDGLVDDEEYADLLSELQGEANYNADFLYDLDDDEEDYSSLLDGTDAVAFYTHTLETAAALNPLVFDALQVDLGRDFHELFQQFKAWAMERQLEAQANTSKDGVNVNVNDEKRSHNLPGKAF